MKNKAEKRTMKWIFEHGRGSIVFIILLTLGSVATSLISLRFVHASRGLIDIATGNSTESFAHGCIAFVLLLALNLLVQITINYINVHASSSLEISLKRDLFRTLMSKDYLSVSKYHSGELLNRINSDVSVIVSGIITIIPSAALFLTSIIGGFVYLYTIDRTLAVIILSIGPFVFVGARLYSRRYKQLHKQCQTADGKTKSFMLEILQNLLVVKSFNNAEAILDRSESLQRESYRLRIKRTNVSILAHLGMYLIFNAGFFLSLIYAAYKLYLGLFNYSDVIAITQLVNQIQTPFKSISSLLPQAFSVIASVERLIELEDLTDEHETGDSLPPDIYEKMSSIVFDNVGFAYNADSGVSGINMTVNRGECAAVVGESGAGKSTAVKLLLGIFKHSSGELYIAAEGKKYHIGKNTRGLFAYVPQGNLILSGTIRENIAFARPEATDEEIINAAKIAQIWDFIASLEAGLNTVIGEHGLGLSEGQAQRISIARALLYNAPVLLLDESTSALDSQTELAFLSALKQLTDKTCILVSHKRAAMDICDKVIRIG